MSRAALFWKSAIGKKVVMGATGLILVAFIILHVLGNLLVFRGPAAMNGYAAFLKSTGELLWLVRLILLAAVILHIVAAYQLTQLDHAARPVPYVRKVPQVTTLAARTMRWGGVILGVFIVFHILHFTTGTIRPAPFSPTDVYANVVDSFRIWWVSAIYVVAMIALGMHLYHGTWSAFRTLGLSRPSADPLRHGAVLVFAAAVWLGFTLIPVAVFFGLLR